MVIVIYEKKQDPLNPDGSMCLYAPDVTLGSDGRYYLYYVLDKVSRVSVAVCDEPAGKYEFYGYVQDENGVYLGDRENDPHQFDPGVLTEDNKTYLYTGFCSKGDTSRKGAMVTVLGQDMLTILEETRYVIPSEPYSYGTSFEGHAFFEAPSIRKRNGLYYLIYSSVAMHELCYATSLTPTSGFEYRGVVSSNCDLHIDSYKPKDQPMYYGGNNHGSIVEIQGSWYIFYHRHTDGTHFSRQGCAEKIDFDEKGLIAQPEMTSCGLNQGPLKGEGEYPAYLACNLFAKEEEAGVPMEGLWLDARFPKITQEGKDGDEVEAFLQNMRDGATAGFKYFDCKGIKSISIYTRGYAIGHFEVSTDHQGEALCRLPVSFTNVWTKCSAEVRIPDGVHGIYIRYCGHGSVSLKSFILEVLSVTSA